MVPLLCLAVLCALQAPAAAPFEFELPEGYSPFAPREGRADSWAAARTVGGAQFVVDHFLLEHAGAFPGTVAEMRRQHFWTQDLQGREHRIEPWTGDWADEEAAGSDILFETETGSRALFERLLVLGDHLILASWEGPADARETGLEGLASFRVPPEWRPAPAEDFDEGRGLVPAAMLVPWEDRLEVTLDLSELGADALAVALRLVPRTPTGEPLLWELPRSPLVEVPAGSIEARPADGRLLVEPDADGSYRLGYRILLEAAEAEQLLGLGLYAQPNAVAFVDPGWLATPRPPAAPDGRPARWLPPAWELAVRLPVPYQAVSWADAGSEAFDEDSGSLEFAFPALPAGRGWPFLLVSRFREEEAAGRELWLRLGSPSSAFDGPARFLDLLSETLAEWLPAADEEWRLATWPASGSRALPGLVLLDELEGWLVEPVDAEWRGHSRRVGLARQIAVRPFGLQLRGAGSGAAFLESSLAEYTAWRLLESAGRTADAEALRRWWERREAEAGPLRQPLSTVPRSDLEGPQRLLSRGALVWLAIEQRAGRKTLDAVLNGFLERGTPWTTEDLRQALEAATSESWEPFFRRCVYGRELPETARRDE